ncbi:MAG TPA: ComF family protein [Candidatus Wallbacteria bacterium]|nr:MAG: DNA utilization protein GntX [bacterium ADurb.Bin243]HOD39815.1 ComF family protein [Candidatus Wallbacteria bacterium]HPG58971.1 ComF family protein [Candidatus Wallbacteria bacterium]
MRFSFFKNFFEAACVLADLVLPVSCAACGKIISRKCFQVCDKCLESIFYINGRPAFDDIACPEICGFYSLGYYEGTLKQLITSFKYNKNKKLAAFFVGEAARRSGGNFLPGPVSGFDALIPVPIHESKLKERGFNQSELLAVEISKIFGIEVCRDAVFRKKETLEQNKLNYDERFSNLLGAFEINYKKVYQIKRKNVIIVDDIITTGATVKSLAALLKTHGALNVFVISVARTK